MLLTDALLLNMLAIRNANDATAREKFSRAVAHFVCSAPESLETATATLLASMPVATVALPVAQPSRESRIGFYANASAGL